MEGSLILAKVFQFKFNDPMTWLLVATMAVLISVAIGLWSDDEDD